MNIAETVAIIGAGPAGIAAALQLQRYKIKFKIFEQGDIGGLLLNANRVENYPGFPGGITGPALVKNFRQQLSDQEIKVDQHEVKQVDYKAEKKHFIIKTDQSFISSKFLIIASGTKSRELPALSPDLEHSNYIFYEVYPLKTCKGKTIAVIGAGDGAFDYALNLAQKENKVRIFNRSNTCKCLSLLYDQVKNNSMISYYPHCSLQSIKENHSGLTLSFKHQKKLPSFEVDRLLIAIGRDPALDFLSENLKLRKNILIKQKVLYFIGDVHNGLYRQTGIAVGEGIKAAMMIFDTLMENNEDFINSGPG